MHRHGPSAGGGYTAMRTAKMVVLACALASGCTRFHVVAPSVPYPVSASRTLYGREMTPVFPGEGLEVVDQLHLEDNHSTILWGLVPLRSTRHDLSAPIGAAVAAAKGDGVVNLTIFTKKRPGWAFFLAWIPLVPSIATVQLEGDIVRYVEVDKNEPARSVP